MLEAAGFTPEPWQRAVLESPASRLLIFCHRQAGKSTVTAALALHQALYTPHSLILCLARAERQAEELLRKVKTFYSALRAPVKAVREGMSFLELANGSRIHALPGKEENLRSFSDPALLVFDEAARVPDALFYSVRAMRLRSQGRMVALTTPFGKRGWFHQEWTQGQGRDADHPDGWERFSLKGSENPSVSPEFLATERREMPDFWYRQEYELEFLDQVDQLFSYEAVRAALDDGLEPFGAEF